MLEARDIFQASEQVSASIEGSTYCASLPLQSVFSRPPDENVETMGVPLGPRYHAGLLK